MPGEGDVRSSRVLVLLNPSAGSYVAEVVEQALERQFAGRKGAYEVHVVRPHERFAELARSAVEGGYGVVVAAGGDGTVSEVAEGLVGSDVPLGIIPLGTANVLARELGIPVDINAACALLAGEFGVTTIDAIGARGQHYFTQLGIGIDALMIRDTTRQDKKRFGRIAYLWTAFKSLAGFQPCRFNLRIDGKARKARASQLLLANCATLGQQPLLWGPEIRPNDGRVDICVIRARTVVDYALVAWHVVLRQHRQSRNIRYFVATREVTISTARALPVQADGEIIGNTPIDVRVVAAALKVAVPRAAATPPVATASGSGQLAG